MKILSDTLKTVSIAARGKRDRFSYGLKDEERAEITATLKRIEEVWCRRRYPEHLSLPEENRLTDFIEEAHRRIGDVGIPDAGKGGNADVFLKRLNDRESAALTIPMDVRPNTSVLVGRR
jgi:hypothetical protein